MDSDNGFLVRPVTRDRSGMSEQYTSDSDLSKSNISYRAIDRQSREASQAVSSGDCRSNTIS